MRGGVSFASMATVRGELDRVGSEVRRRLADLDDVVGDALPTLGEDEAARYRAARERCEVASDDLCAVLDSIGVALCTARESGRAGIHAKPAWS